MVMWPVLHVPQGLHPLILAARVSLIAQVVWLGSMLQLGHLPALHATLDGMLNHLDQVSVLLAKLAGLQLLLAQRPISVKNADHPRLPHPAQVPASTVLQGVTARKRVQGLAWIAWRALKANISQMEVCCAQIV